MNILVINGPNLNMLGIREPGIYGNESYENLCDRIQKKVASFGGRVTCFQSNHEGAIIDEIQAAYGVYDGIIINPGAYTHYSYAILDALKAVSLPTVEVHISDIRARESFRSVSVTEAACFAQIAGEGLNGYLRAIDLLREKLDLLK